MGAGPKRIALTEALQQRLPEDWEVRQWLAICYLRQGKHYWFNNSGSGRSPTSRKRAAPIRITRAFNKKFKPVSATPQLDELDISGVVAIDQIRRSRLL